MSNGTLYWKPENFTYFLHRFLSEVKTSLDGSLEGTILVAELASSGAKSVEFHLQEPGDSELGFFFKELDKRISKYL